MKCFKVQNADTGLGSLRSPERGLKYCTNILADRIKASLRSPERGLKSISANSRKRGTTVAPFAGAWIEIIDINYMEWCLMSLRSPERGLKFSTLSLVKQFASRSVRRSVD